jgi:amino acid adenylation domain-containing protein
VLDHPAGKCSDAEPPLGAKVNALIHAHGAARPHALAVAAPDATLTYQELLGRAAALRARLRELGVGPGVPVGLCLPRSAAMVVGALAILDAGGAYVAMDPNYPEDRLRFMLADSGARVVVTARSSGIAVDGVTVVPDEDTATELIGPATGADSDLAYIIYTSGSSGFPKGVMVEHRSLRRLVDWHCRAFGVMAADRASQIASPGFDACVWEVWSYLAAGASIHIPDDDVRVNAAALRDWMLAREITISFLPTALAEAQMVLEWPDPTPLRAILTGGDVLHRKPSARLPFAVINNYGLTEATVVSTSGEVPSETVTARVPSIGRAIDGAELFVVDHNLRPLPDGVEGELLVGGPLVARGYVNDPAQTAWRFAPDHLSNRVGARLLRTGDIVRRRPDGYFEFVGRTDNQVKVHGFRIELDEIAATIARHPDVLSSAIVAGAANSGQSGLFAYVVPRGDPPEPAALDEFLAARLPAHMLPGGYAWLAELPLTANGKVDRSALAQPSTAPGSTEQGKRGPSNETEAVLASIVAKILRLDRIGVDENFFRLGGHSLLAAQLIMQVEDRFGVDLPLRFLFDSPTVAAIANEIERLSFDGGAPRLAATHTDGGA